MSTRWTSSRALPPAPAAAGTTQGDAAQYILEKLKLSDVHRMVRGSNVPIAVIDSVDAHIPISRAWWRSASARWARRRSPTTRRHGGRHRRTSGCSHRAGSAPARRARLLDQRGDRGEHHVQHPQGHRLVGEGGRPHHQYEFRRSQDPSLEAALKIAYERGIVLIAAAGNAEPKSPPLFPGAFLPMIAVTATDVDDKLFTGANRGKYVSVAAPGVDILVPAPENAYQITTGTSVAAAEVSGIVALLLERNPARPRTCAAF